MATKLYGLNVFLLALLLIVGGCSSSTASGQRPMPTPVPIGNPCGDGEILFSVIMLDGRHVSDVEISVASKVNGLTRVGATNRFGDACVKKAEAFAPDVLCLLFCARNFYCTALLNEKGLSEFRERAIVISPLVMF